jgi:pimeloyl-ACP methyl ester carboxylesterase
MSVPDTPPHRQSRATRRPRPSLQPAHGGSLRHVDSAVHRVSPETASLRAWRSGCRPVPLLSRNGSACQRVHQKYRNQPDRYRVFQNLVTDHRVIAFDLRGHGKSGKPHEPSAYGAEMVPDALRLLDHLGIRRAHIVGYSLGAIITAKLLATNPERFGTATLGGHAGYRNWRPEFDRNAERTALEFEGDVPFRSLETMTPADEPKRSEADIRSRSDALAAVNDVRALAAYYRGGTRDFNSTDDVVSATKVSVLGIIGSLDNVRSMNHCRAFCRRSNSWSSTARPMWATVVLPVGRSSWERSASLLRFTVWRRAEQPNLRMEPTRVRILPRAVHSHR